MTNFKPGQQVKAKINSVIGYLPAVIVRDITGTDWAKTYPMGDGEMYEIKYTSGPARGQYTPCSAHYLKAA